MPESKVYEKFIAWSKKAPISFKNPVLWADQGGHLCLRFINTNKKRRFNGISS